MEAPPLYKKALELAEERLGDIVVCVRCGATVKTFDDKCNAALDEMCPGFVTIDKARTQAMKDVGFIP